MADNPTEELSKRVGSVRNHTVLHVMENCMIADGPSSLDSSLDAPVRAGCGIKNRADSTDGTTSHSTGCYSELSEHSPSSPIRLTIPPTLSDHEILDIDYFRPCATTNSVKLWCLTLNQSDVQPKQPEFSVRFLRSAVSDRYNAVVQVCI